ncbi:MAG TPA: SPOR domain-containing protein [Steroidobacteraceae bacterium]|nr:SPOR domain-containing protein [Steroidobacteraceae bacterium]
MDTLVKERLTGAIILVALIVVLVPELLSGPIRPAVRAHGPGSSAEEPPLRSYTINLADEAHGGSGSLEPQPASAPSPRAPLPENTSPASLAQSAIPEPAAPRTTTPPTAASQPTTASAHPAAPQPGPAAASPPAPTTQAAGSGAYVVQLGSFASRANAERLAHQVHGMGFQVSVSRGSTGRRLYRVQVGPAHDHAAAEQMAAKLRTQGHAGTVVPR